MANLTDVLEQGHREIDSRFRQFEHTRDPVTALEACEGLRRHMDLEALVMCPMLASEISVEWASQVEERHNEARNVASEVEACREENRFRELVTQLRQLALRHWRDNSQAVLPLMAESLGPAEMARLGEDALAFGRQYQGEAGVIDLVALEAEAKSNAASTDEMEMAGRRRSSST